MPGQPSRDDFRNPPTFGKLGASLHIAVYRRNARVAFSRTAYRILDVSELSAPILQQFPAQSWFTGLSALFSAPNMTSSSILSAGLANSLYRTSSLTKLERLTVGRERFSNLMAMTLLVHQSNFLANGYNYPSNISLDPMIRRPSPLADEEYMPLYIRPTTPQLVGTYCVAGKRSIPSLATIIAYAIVAGLLVISLFIGKFYTFHFFPVKLSGFTLVDMEALVLLESEEGLDGGTMSDTFDSDGRYNTETIMNKAATLRVRLRERA